MSTSMQPKYIPWKNVEHEQLNELIGREMVVGDKIMLARVFLKKGAHVPMHHHHNEPVTYILEGALKFAIDGKEIVGRSPVHPSQYAPRSLGHRGYPRPGHL